MRYKKLLPFIGVVLFVYILSRLNISELKDTFYNANYGYVLLAFLLMGPLVIVQAVKWGVLLKSQNIKVGFNELLKLNLIGQFYGVVTPGRLGNFLRIKYLSDSTGKSVGECSSSVILDRLLDTFALFSLALYGTLIIASSIIWSIFLLFILLVFAVWVFWSKKRSEFLLKIVYKYFIPKRLKGLARKSFHEFYSELPKMKSRLVHALFLNIVAWIFVYTIVYIITLAIYPGLNYFFVIGAWPIATVISLIPITVSGFGTREITLISLFGLKGVPPEAAVSMSLTAYFVSTVFMGVIGGVLALKRKDGKVH